MRVKFNGKELDTDFKTSLEFFENISKNENDVWIINGFATKENIALNENDELFCIEKYFTSKRRTRCYDESKTYTKASR